MERLIDADRYMKHLKTEMGIEADIIAKYVKEDTPIGTIKDGSRIGRLQGIQWCKNELDYYTVEAIPKAEYETRLKADLEVILDKVRAEIEQERVGYPPSAGYYKAIMKCLQILNKYKTESEE